MPRGLEWLDSGSATGKEERTVSQARLGTLGWPISPWHAARPVRKSRRLSVCFPADATSVFPLLCSVHSAGSRARLAGGQAGQAPSAAGLVPREHPLLPQANVVTRVPGTGLQNHTDKTSRPLVVISGGKAGRLLGKDSRLFPSPLSSNALISFPARRGLLTSHTQKKTPPKIHNPAPWPPHT